MNTLTKIGLASLVALSIAGIASAETSVSVAPATATKNLGETLQASVELSTQNDSVCVISGDISFTNLSCQTISIAAGIMAQSAPSCQNPHFVVGIPQCVVGAKTLLNISAQATIPGTGSINLANVETINQSNKVISTSANGSYAIQGVLSSSTSSASSPTTPNTTTTPEPATGNATPTNETVSPAAAGGPAAVSTTPAGNGLLASIKDALLNKDAAWILGILVLLAIAYYVVKSFYKKTPSQQ